MPYDLVLHPPEKNLQKTEKSLVMLMVCEYFATYGHNRSYPLLQHNTLLYFSIKKKNFWTPIFCMIKFSYTFCILN